MAPLQEFYAMQGLHLTADLYGCQAPEDLLTNADTLAQTCRRLTDDAGLTVVADRWHTFPDYQGQPGGVTGMILLAESHLALHTWPERQGVTLDVYVCNFTCDNSPKAEQLIENLEKAFAATDSQRERLQRGDENGPSSREWITEDLNPHSRYAFAFTRRLLDQHTPYQHLQLFDSPMLGRTMRLDGHFMTAEREEFFYHEAMAHPAAVAHPNPQRALIIGGGDGGLAEELLKHPSIQNVVLAELDEAVVQASRQHLQAIHQGALNNPRVDVRIMDGAAFIDTTDERFDLVLLDLTDPETPAGALYTQAFFQKCKRILTEQGALVLHLGAPFYEPEQVSQLAAALRASYQHTAFYGLHIPLYGAYWGLAVVSDTLDPTALHTADVQQRLDQRGVDQLQYYNAAVHGALFALPTYYGKLVQPA
ncbi:MAG: polyamine aminopropyltransferase [Burkholderiaceae bacterium]